MYEENVGDPMISEFLWEFLGQWKGEQMDGTSDTQIGNGIVNITLAVIRTARLYGSLVKSRTNYLVMTTLHFKHLAAHPLALCPFKRHPKHKPDDFIFSFLSGVESFSMSQHLSVR